MTWEHISGEGGSSENPNFKEFFSQINPKSPTSVQVSNYPNPFNAQTRIEYSVPLEYAGDPLRISIYDIGGRLIKTLFNGIPTSENNFVIWDATDTYLKPVSTGTYFYLVKTSQEAKTGKIMHIK